MEKIKHKNEHLSSYINYKVQDIAPTIKAIQHKHIYIYTDMHTQAVTFRGPLVTQDQRS